MDEILDKIKDIDNGRFSKLFDTIRIDDDCMRCFYFNPTITDPGLGYRCKAAPTCIAATLSQNVQSYILWKLGVITMEQHTHNIEADKILKVGNHD
jgi:hypothetical protein